MNADCRLSKHDDADRGCGSINKEDASALRNPDRSGNGKKRSAYREPPFGILRKVRDAERFFPGRMVKCEVSPPFPKRHALRKGIRKLIREYIGLNTSILAGS